MTTFLFKAGRGEIAWNSDHNEMRFKQMMIENEGKDMRMEVETDDRETERKRRFFESAVVPYYFYQNPKSGWLDFSECREAIKLRHNYTFIKTIGGAAYRIPKSTKISNNKFREFLEKIEHDFMENGFVWPDPEAYKDWEKTNMTDKEYPPLEELREKYSKNKHEPITLSLNL